MLNAAWEQPQLRRGSPNKVPYVESQNHWQHKVLNIEYLSDKAHNKGNSRTSIIYSLVGLQQESSVWAEIHYTGSEQVPGHPLLTRTFQGLQSQWRGGTGLLAVLTPLPQLTTALKRTESTDRAARAPTGPEFRNKDRHFLFGCPPFAHVCVCVF